MSLCPCGSTLEYSSCCQPIHTDPRQASKPEQLMRARFSAHVLKLTDFVVATYHPSCNALAEKEAIAQSVDNHWTRLEVVSSESGSNDDEGYVTFNAYLIENSQEICLSERSRFIKEEQQWYYIDGELSEVPSAKVGRNDPCPCGSGKKFKKCCG